MYKTMTRSLTRGTRIVQVLLQRFGVKLLQRVEQVEENVFLAQLKDGRVFQAVVQMDGRLSVQEMEGTA